MLGWRHQQSPHCAASASVVTLASQEAASEQKMAEEILTATVPTKCLHGLRQT
jgi:hypothetical protein